MKKEDSEYTYNKGNSNITRTQRQEDKTHSFNYDIFRHASRILGPFEMETHYSDLQRRCYSSSENHSQEHKDKQQKFFLS